MANAPAPTEKSGSANHWKDIFDQSLAILCDGANSVPMRRSYLPLRIDAVTLQKRALSSAADALAAEFAHQHRLGGDRRMVDSRQPVGILAEHAMVAREHVHRRKGRSVP